MSNTNKAGHERSAETQFPQQRNANKKGRGPSTKTPAMGDIMVEKIQIGIRGGKPVYMTRQEIMVERRIALALSGNRFDRDWVLDRYHAEAAAARERARKSKTKATTKQRRVLLTMVTDYYRPLLALDAELQARGIVEVRGGTRRLADQAMSAIHGRLTDTK